MNNQHIIEQLRDAEDNLRRIAIEQQKSIDEIQRLTEELMKLWGVAQCRKCGDFVQRRDGESITMCGRCAF